MSYYPLGMTSSNIPGFNERDIEFELNCDYCTYDGTAPATQDGRIVTGICPWCSAYFELEVDDD